MSITQRVGSINILLIALSFLAAFFFPVQTFILSVLVLGPLHYITELVWLKEKKFYLPQKSDVQLLFIIGSVSFLGYLLSYLLDISPINDWLKLFLSSSVIQTLQAYRELCKVIAFPLAFLMIFSVKESYKYLLILFLLLVFSLISPKWNYYFIVIGILIGVFLHTYIFMIFFMIFGALKSRSVLGLVAVLFFMGLTFLVFYIEPNPSYYERTPYFDKLYSQTLNPDTIRLFLSWLFRGSQLPSYAELNFATQTLLLIRFLGFMYLYHYLNWFSKTEIIRWHLTPKNWLVGGTTLWIMCVVLYFVDFKLGLVLTSLLGSWHVLLEFPLNHRTMVGIVQEVRKIVAKE